MIGGIVQKAVGIRLVKLGEKIKMSYNVGFSLLDISAKMRKIILCHTLGVAAVGLDTLGKIGGAGIDGHMIFTHLEIVARADNIIEIRAIDGGAGVLLNAKIDLYLALIFLFQSVDLGAIALGVLHTVPKVVGRIAVRRKADGIKALLYGRRNHLLGCISTVAKGTVSM